MSETTPSPGGRRFRKLRMAISAACGVLCLLLIMLWIRSYHRLGLLESKWSATRSIAVGAVNGRIVILEAPSTLSSAWSSLLDAHVDIVLQQDAGMAVLKQQLAYTELARAQWPARGRPSRAASLDRKIAVLNRQIQQYRDQMSQHAAAASLNILSPTPSQTGSSLSKAMHRLGFGLNRFPGGQALSIPFWFSVAIVGLLAALFGMKSRWRFSLRTLLIGMTVIAALMGTTVWVTR
jgi:hypothetical protein